MYYTKVKNLIGANELWQYVNIDDANMTGGEIGLKWKKNQIFASADYAYVKTEDESTGFELIRRPRQTFTFTTGYDDGTYGVNTSLIAHSHANAQARQNSIKVPGYTTIDLNAFWNVNPNIKLFTNIQNIGDVKYKAVYSSTDTWYINGGRFASAGVTFRY